VGGRHAPVVQRPFSTAVIYCRLAGTPRLDRGEGGGMRAYIDKQCIQLARVYIENSAKTSVAGERESVQRVTAEACTRWACQQLELDREW
jgi:hypothetical protein